MSAILDFFKTGWGIAVFTIVAIAIILFVLAVWYRVFAKAMLDFLCGLILTIVLSPCIAVCSIIVKVKSGKVLSGKYFVGKGGKLICLHTFNYYEAEEGKPSYISRSSLARLPYLFDVLACKLSLVGPAVVSYKDSCFIDDEPYTRFDVRPGIINPAITKVKDRPSYDELFELDCEYTKKFSLFGDIYAVIWLVVRFIRGERVDLSCRKITYSQELLSQGLIRQEDITEAEESETQAVIDNNRAKFRIQQ